MTKRVVFIGAAGSGKSTLAAQLFAEMKRRHLNAELVPEWIRADLWSHGPMTTIWEQYRTLGHQRAVEDAVPPNVEWVITDSGTLTPIFYASIYIDHNEPRQRLVLQDMHRFLLDDLYARRYSHVFYIPMMETYRANPDILDDGTRFQTPEQIETIEMHMNLVFDRLYKLDNIYALRSPLEQRLGEVMEILKVA
jgi:nicotinamide riboside kinase